MLRAVIYKFLQAASTKLPDEPIDRSPPLPPLYTSRSGTITREPVPFVANDDVRRHAPRCARFVARFGEADRITTLPFLHSSALAPAGWSGRKRKGGISLALCLALVASFVRSFVRGEATALS